MPGEGRGLSSRQTQDVVRDLEIGQPSNSEKGSETADGVTRESEGGSWLSLLRSVRQDQPRGYPGACLCPVPLEQGRTGSRRSGLCGHRSVWGGAVAGRTGACAQGRDIPTGADQTRVHRHAVEHRGATTPVPVPETVHAVLAERIDRLAPAAKHLLQTAAVLGIQMTEPLLHAVVAWADAELHTGLQQLQAAESLYETGVVPVRTYTFKHALTQEVAYHSLLTHTRQQYHQRIAQVLREHFPTRAETQPELVAQHYTAAGLPAEALPYWQRAGQLALQRSANPEALGHLTTALELLATLPDTPSRAQQELDLRMTLGPVLMALKGQAAPEVEQTNARAWALCQQVGETPQRFPALWWLQRFYRGQGAFPTARELGEQLVQFAERDADPTRGLEAHDALGIPCSSSVTTPLPGCTWSRGARAPTWRHSGTSCTAMAKRLGCGAWPLGLGHCGA